MVLSVVPLTDSETSLGWAEESSILVRFHTEDELYRIKLTLLLAFLVACFLGTCYTRQNLFCGSPMASMPFSPGDTTRIRVPKSITSPKCISVPMEPRSFSVEIPARVGFSVKNMATFAPGKPGGGGVGLTTNIFSRTFVTVSSVADRQSGSVAFLDVVSSNNREKILMHHIAVFRECMKSVSDNSKFAVWVHHEEAFDKHCGLGSTSGAALGVLHGINLCLGSPFSKEQIRDMLAFNYVEEDQNDSECVVYGYETTMTAVGANGGGMYVIHEDTLEVEARNTFAFKNLPVYIFSPSKTRDGEIMNEMSILAEGAASDAKEEEAAKKCRIFNEILIPELSKEDSCNLMAIGSAIFELQTSGGKRVEVMKQPGGDRVVAFMKMVKHRVSEATIIGMSSIGPSTVIVCNDPLPDLCERLDEVAGACGMERKFITTVNVEGMKFTEFAFPRLIVVAGKPGAGKSTLCQSSGMNFFSAGAYLRQFASQPHASALQKARAAIFLDIIASGEVRDRGNVSSTVLLEELYQRICRAGHCGVWLLDGFPRSGEQLEVMTDAFGARFFGIALLKASDETRERRVASGRPERAHLADPALATRDVHDLTDDIIASATQRRIPILELDNNSGGIDAALDALKSSGWLGV